MSPHSLDMAGKLRDRLAESGLPRPFAKLYSQHSRLQAGMPGLIGWGQAEAAQRLMDATQLIEAALIEKENSVGGWKQSMRRAAELLEWLAHPTLNPQQLPIPFLAAATYQLAGYPARSLGLLNYDLEAQEKSEVIEQLLIADFPRLLNVIVGIWQAQAESGDKPRVPLSWEDPDLLHGSLHSWVIFEMSGALGILCAYMRWGDESRLNAAINKLDKIAALYSHAKDPYSFLLAKLCSLTSQTFVESALRKYLKPFCGPLTEDGKKTVERYLRQCHLYRKSLAWPSQIRGIKKLIDGDSFALCTPTASGKTTVAELAIIQSLSKDTCTSNSLAAYSELGPPMVIYLVPSKALASEVEAKLSQVMERASEEKVVVSGMYGGTDWGPTDAWLTTQDKAVAICTYEKAEALLRFLGPLFLYRVCLVIIDEAHQIQFDGNLESLKLGENRSLRLESLCMRLLSCVSENNGRVIALSAVASGSENAIASMISGTIGPLPITTYYRSTRQLIGRLECLSGRRFEIRYDILDGVEVKFEDGGTDDGPFIRNPFPPFPPAPELESGGPEKQLRPYLFWAAAHLAAPDEYGRKRSVLISIAQQVEGYAKDFLDLLESTWASSRLPNFFSEPDTGRGRAIWEKCLGSCEDYFGVRSREYQLLKKGVVLHHGKMPGLMGRLLISVIQERIINLVLATSTLSEGVNLPFEVVLIPTLRRYSGDLNIREFSNLVGRAGRPGYGTEGRSLVLLPPEPSRLDRSRPAYSARTTRQRYFSLIEELLKRGEGQSDPRHHPSSALAELLGYIGAKWQELTGLDDQDKFFRWLEQTAPLDASFGNLPESAKEATQALDSLDSLLLSIQVETEGLMNVELDLNQLEDHLKTVWRHTYAHFASNEEKQLEKVFIRRGLSLRKKIYPDASQRRQLYRTSLPPRSGMEIMSLYDDSLSLFNRGHEYFWWKANQRFDFIRDVIALVSTCSKFKIEEPSKRLSWEQILKWWIDPVNAKLKPTEKQISKWFSYISKNFQYRFNWGLGCLLAVAINKAHQGELRPTTLEDWPDTGLPWVMFWMKELIVWGSLDPVTAYLISKGQAVTRKEAGEIAAGYYEECKAKSRDADPLNASQIRSWVESQFKWTPKPGESSFPGRMKVELMKDFSGQSQLEWRVLPVVIGKDLYWYDPAGFGMAKSEKPSDWKDSYRETYDFLLKPSRRQIVAHRYL